MGRLPIVLSLALLTFFTVSCGQEQPTQPLDVDPSFLIQDAVHDGNPHFFWLPPMVGDPGTFNGPFDDTVEPVVKICELNGGACAAQVAEFTMYTGPGSETVRVVPLDEHFIVNWHTDEFTLAPAPTTYRIIVFVGDTELGLADVQFGETGKEVKRISASGEFVGLQDGRTLPIKFRIEVGALFTTLYGVEASKDGLSVIDPVTGVSTFIGPLHNDICKYTTPVAMAVRPSDGTIFVWNNSDGGMPCPFQMTTGVLLTVDPDDGLATQVSTTNQGPLQALAFAPDGRLFGLENQLFEINPETGVRTLVGTLLIEGTEGLRIGGAAFDASGTLFGLELASGAKRLVTINTSTAAVTVVGVLNPNPSEYAIGSIVFDPTGTLIGSAQEPGVDTDELFDINKLTGAVSNVRTISGGYFPQGMGFGPPGG
jgi:hypothetical protein